MALADVASAMDAGFPTSTMNSGFLPALATFAEVALEAPKRVTSPVPNLLSASDLEILQRISAGDLEAFGAFYDRHSALLFGLLVKILRDYHDAEEVLQEAMAQIWERASSYDESLGKPLSWAIALARNKAIDRLRSSQRKAKWVQEAAPEVEHQMVNAGDVSADQKAAFTDSSEAMRRALQSLPTDQRTAIEMAFLRGLTHAEIAEELKEPLGTIKARIRRGMMTLRECLEGQL